MFRYERPQKGRLRQFHQVGVEVYSKSGIEKDFIKSSGLKNFLSQNAKEWIKQTVNKEINKCDIIESWIVRQFENEYNPLHSHSGHISGVGYLKVPDNFGETVQKNKSGNFNGHLQLVHGTKMFLSPVMWTVKMLPESRQSMVDYLMLNPMVVPISMIRSGFDGTELGIDTFYIVYSVAFCLTSLLLGSMIFKRYESMVVKYL